MKYRFPVLVCFGLFTGTAAPLWADDAPVAAPPAAEAPQKEGNAKRKEKPGKKGVKPKPAEAPPVAAKVPEPLPDCLTYLATPLDSTVLAIKDSIYFTSPKLPGDDSMANGYLFESVKGEPKAKRLVGFKGNRITTLVEHSVPLEAISLFDFTAGSPACGEGRTTGISVRWLIEKKVQPSYPAANYAFLPGDLTGLVADLDKSYVQSLDFESRQLRTIYTFTPGTRPLYIKASVPVELYTYDPSNRELAHFAALKPIPKATFKLKDGARLLQDGSLFGFVEPRDTGHILAVSRVKDWSGKEDATVELALPKTASANGVLMHADFETDRYLVFGKDESYRKAMREVFLFEGKNLATTFKAPLNQYFSAARFGRNGAVILLVSNLTNGAVDELWVKDGKAAIEKVAVLKPDRPKPVPEAVPKK